MTSSEEKYVYYFGDGHAEGNAKMKDVLGGKGAGLAEMTNIGVPVPPGFTISTGVCTYFYDHDKTYPPALKGAVAENLAKVEQSVGRKFGDRNKPLLVSVRSGARASMPGYALPKIRGGVLRQEAASLFRAYSARTPAGWARSWAEELAALGDR